MSPSEDPVHPSAIGENTQVNTESNDQSPSASTPDDTSYPPQLHAGAVGYGPNYRQGPTFTDKVTGVKEEIKGKVTRHPDLVQQGHDRRTGELKRRERDEDDGVDPFATPGEDEKKDKEQAATV
ncbi:hypothetical protein E1B28_005985 [Marasmius oreades]|uniref:Uncharacterized protein n=1 Tax=Marasmius oreades TaxID=181124 RepID=A0A9P7UVE1_9AGAR|nr:uncharacterized protein E1B28_005985 [Marasmius oreades]KAG7095210.1 hypothetical protein E1B28_005985 [Marasmius oreades]